ncbi:hypothetical protein E0H89_03640 [Acinetobacter sp. ANC 3781]|uniref:hypothetical protein n=1 Tax=Acinetobacter sp. ANC 3781 TaxID=2529835 RepID=UPI0010401E72|nr:hypothetical protein [Acinetobacter sp. ANC 3781]TCB79357.1 hypothetical protein E0H89_03640 [Acinetobacter sp. ANC 3781]
MNNHLKTLIGFKNGTKKIAKDSFYDLWDACDELISAFKTIGKVVFVLIIWLFSLVLVCILPLATWLRLKWEREHEAAVEKAEREYMERMTCLHQKDGANDINLTR